MKKRIKLIVVYLLSFFIWSSVFYFGVTEYRADSLNDLMASFPRLSEEERTLQVEESIDSVREDLNTLSSPLDEIFSDPSMVDYVTSAYAHSLSYQIRFFDDVLPTSIEMENTALFTKFFHVYGKLYSFETLRFAGFAGFADAQGLGPFADFYIFDKMGAAVVMWEAKGNQREGKWLDEFLHSPEYVAFLEETFHKIETPEDDVSVEYAIEKIRQLHINQSHNPFEYLKNHFLHDAKHLAEIEFQAYKQHKAEGDFVVARYDAEVIREIWHYIKAAENLNSLQYNELHQSASFFPDPFVDLTGIFSGALITSIIIVYISTKRVA